MSADEIRQPLMRERQRHGDALGQNSSPALRQVPEREQQPIIDSLMVSDRQRDRERVSAARPRLKSSSPSCGHGVIRTTKWWLSTASRAGSNTTQPTSA